METAFLDSLNRYNNTAAVTDKGTTIVRLYNTNIVVMEKEESGRVITLNTNGWKTATTKKRMNEVFSCLGLRLDVYQENYEWFVDLGDGNVTKYYDGMVLTQAFGSHNAVVVPQ